MKTEPTSIAKTINYPVPLIGFAAYSGTGKTTLLTKLLPQLKARGLRVAVVKHAHHSFEIDQSGKDSMRIRQAGADQILVASRHRTALIKEHHDKREEPCLEEALSLICPDEVDLVLVEGFKHTAIPKIELHRCALKQPFLYLHDHNIIALVSDCELPPKHSEKLPHFSLEQTQAIADFIVTQQVKSPVLSNEPLTAPLKNCVASN